MIEKSFLDAIPSILEYKLYGLITVILLINLILLIYVINKENMKTAVIKIIKLFMIGSLVMLISFFMFKFFNKPVPPSAKEWSIRGNIELQDRNGKVLQKISKDDCGKPLRESIPLQEFLSNNLKIIILPNLISKSFGFSHFTANIPENLGQDDLDVLFQIDGFRCNSENCIRKLNNSNYNLNLKTMIFVQDKLDKDECDSQSNVGTY